MTENGMRLGSLCLGLMLATSAGAAERNVMSCEAAGVGLTALITPVAAHARDFYEGRVHLYAIDMLEPACCSVGVAVVVPDPLSELGDNQCFAVVGNYGVDVEHARASYSPAKGLSVQIATKTYSDDGVERPGEPLRLRINLKDGSVAVEK